MQRPLRKTRRLELIFSVCLFAICHWNASAQSQYQSSTDFAKFAIKLRENGLAHLWEYRPDPLWRAEVRR